MASIGHGVIRKFDSGFINLATSFVPVERFEAPDPEHALPKLIASPAGTPKEYAAFLASIMAHMDQNQAIPPDAFCTSPEAVAHLPTPDGVSVYRKQYRLAYYDRPIVVETYEKWKADQICAA